MRIGIDFDNTIICYDDVFCQLAKDWQLIAPDFTGSKRSLRDNIQASAAGDIGWQRLQGKAYGEFIHLAKPFNGFHDFIAACQRRTGIELFIVSHKTEFGHFDENKIPLREAAKSWLKQQNILTAIKEENIFFETTREEKIARIQALRCTHFIDDLIEVLDSPLFPTEIKRLLFQPAGQPNTGTLTTYTNWTDIQHAILI